MDWAHAEMRSVWEGMSPEEREALGELEAGRAEYLRRREEALSRFSAEERALLMRYNLATTEHLRNQNRGARHVSAAQSEKTKAWVVAKAIDLLTAGEYATPDDPDFVEALALKLEAQRDLKTVKQSTVKSYLREARKEGVFAHLGHPPRGRGQK